jgi:hypothetical protein
MKIWRANHQSTAVDDILNDHDVLAARKERTKDVQEIKDDLLNRPSSIMAMRQEANVVEDARNDKLSPKFSKKKELRRHSKHHKIMVVRNSHTNNDDVTAARDLPEGVAEPKSNNHHSLTLSRLLFTKQHMEQRDQVKVVYNQFSPNAIDVLTIQPDDGMPSPDQPDHVVIKVQVGFFCVLSLTLDNSRFYR